MDYFQEAKEVGFSATEIHIANHALMAIKKEWRIPDDPQLMQLVADSLLRKMDRLDSIAQTIIKLVRDPSDIWEIAQSIGVDLDCDQIGVYCPKMYKFRDGSEIEFFVTARVI